MKAESDTVRASQAAAPELSVVLCTLNGSATIGDQLEALRRQRTERCFEVVVVDNGSTDETADIVLDLARTDERFRLVGAPERQNLSYARNVGVESACAPAVAFCDDDDVVDAGWVEALAAGLERNPWVASAIEYEALNDPEHTVGRSRFQSAHIGEMFGLPITNGIIAIERDLWRAVGGNDEAFGRTGEDFDFSLRVVEQTGVVPVLAVDAVYHHRLRAGGRGTFRQARRFGESHVQLYQRHGRGRVDVAANNRAAVADWWWILSRAPLALFGVRRENWATHAGRRVGRLIGSLKYRTPYL